ncbi:MAG: tRNA adenosine(34) deaminase TadA [Bacilli bacterium]|nr:tRNA adenosine(34) deaminase TadA [Bacilli bacterium]
MNKDIKYMRLAIKEAKKAELIDEVPIGCVIVKDDKVIARGFNHREIKKMVTSHAEIEAINKANKKLGAWRLEDCDIYVTLEPCIMCAGSIIQARFRRVIYGASDFKGGAFGSSIDVLKAQNINHYPEIVRGVLQEECSQLLSEYFKRKRK